MNLTRRVRPAPIGPWEATARPRVFWIGATAILLSSAFQYHDPDFIDLLGFLAITVTALLPAFLWCQRAAQGVPIYPIFAISTIWTFAFPLISSHPLVIQYEPMERLGAAVTVAGVNLTGTAGWFFLTRRAGPSPTSYYGFRPGSGNLFFLGSLVVSVIFTFGINSYVWNLDVSVVSFFRAIVMALANLATFALGYQFGQGRLGRAKKVSYCVLMALLILATLPNAMMVLGLSYSLLGIIGFALGRGRIPWLALGLLAATALFLQEGKTALREKYWSGLDRSQVSLSRFPEFLSDWIQFSAINFSRHQNSGVGTGEDESQSFTERASLMHLFLHIQRMSPASVPYLSGETYAIIPQLLVPRIFHPEKSPSHLGTFLLAIRYDIQSEEETHSTTIGFGLINESLANFGHLGCLALGAALGIFYGWAARLSASYPLLSFRTLLTILVLTVSFQDEFTAGVFISTLFQGTCALLMLGVLTMRRVETSAGAPSFKARKYVAPSRPAFASHGGRP